MPLSRGREHLELSGTYNKRTGRFLVVVIEYDGGLILCQAQVKLLT